jgi:hypothetical protein
VSRYVLAFLLLLPGLFNREALDRMLGDIERMANAN